MEENQEVYVAKTACGGKLKDISGFPSALYSGKTIYFCTGACLRVFEKDPNAFMSGEVEHPQADE